MVFLIFEWVNGSRGKQLSAVIAPTKHRAWETGQRMFPGHEVHAVAKADYEAEMNAMHPHPAA